MAAPVPLDDSYRGKITLLVVEDTDTGPTEVWLDMVDYEARFGRKVLEARLGEDGLMLVG